MELHAEDRFIFQSQTFQRVIVQTFVGDFHFVLIQIPFGDTIIMILRSDQALRLMANVEQDDFRRDDQI